MLAYVEPTTLEQALDLLAEDEEARPLAGGQSLMVLLRLGLARPRSLISLQTIPGLDGIVQEGDRLRIGPMVTYRRLTDGSEVPVPDALRDACELVGPIPVQNAGTLGGSLCHNAPGADVPPALLALGAEAVIRSPSGVRVLPLSSFFRGYFETALRPGELLTAITVPGAISSSAYLKFSYRMIDMAMVGVAVAFRLEGGVARNVRIALGGVDAVPFRATTAEAAVEGLPLEPEILRDAGRLAAEERAAVSDIHASGAYRRRIIPPLVRRAFEKAMVRCM